MSLILKTHKAVIADDQSFFLRDIRYLTRWGFGMSMFLFVILHILKPAYNPLYHYIGEYANGNLGILMILAFISFGFGLLGLSFQAYRLVSGIRTKITFSFIFVLCAFSVLILALFPVNIYNSPVNTSTLIHFQTLPIFLGSVMIGVAAFTFRMRREKSLVKLYKTSVILSIPLWISFTGVLFFGNNPEFQGLVQRIFVLYLWLWFMQLSWRITGE